MDLFWNETLLLKDPSKEAIEKAVERLLQEEEAELLLRKDSTSSIRVTHDPGIGFMMDVAEPKAMFGLAVPDAAQEAVVAALVEYRKGGKPQLPWGEAMRAAGDKNTVEFVGGDAYDHDCPLCALMETAG